MRPLFIAVAFALGAATAAPVPKELKKQDDKAAIVGTWTMTRCNVSGMDRVASWRTLTFDADGKVTASRDGKPVFVYATVLDPTAAPRRMPWKGGGETLYECVYQFTADGLTVVVPHDNKQPPASLDPGPRVTVYEFKRADAK